MDRIEALYLAHRDEIYSYLLWLTRDSSLSEDLLQETFVKAISSIGGFRGESSVRTWLFSIARHSWLHQLRKRRPSECIDDCDIRAPGDVDDRLFQRQTLKRTMELLSDKDERTQKIVRLRYRGYSYCEIAKDLGISENSARVIEFRTKRDLKTALEREGYF